MPGPRDADNILRDSSDGDLTTTETITHTIDGGVAHTVPLGVSVLVPSQAGSSPTLSVTAKFTSSDKKVEVTHTDNIDSNSTFPFLLHLPLPPSDDDSLSVVLTVGGSSPDFGEVEVWLERARTAKVDVDA